MRHLVAVKLGMVLLVVSPVLGKTSDESSSERTRDTACCPASSRWSTDCGAEYLTPTHDDRDIRTISVNVLRGTRWFAEIPFAVYGGMTITNAWGTIRQWDSNFHDMTYPSNAYGIGPVFLARLQPFSIAGFAPAAEFSGGIILYSHRFPRGGDIYNFMWRTGGSVGYHIDKNCILRLSVKWMHVSNGQGLGPQNPSYEAWGVGVGVEVGDR